MSAIYGLVRLNGAPVTDGELARMGRALAHRGPDGQAEVALDNAGLGHRLLRVNREDRFEAQPLHDTAQGVTLVADLRLDNREALATAIGISGEQLASLSDSDLVLHAWRTWGPDCLSRLLGDFTIAVRDHRRKRLYLARDAMGQRGLYVYRSDRLVVFASEIKALFAVGDVPQELSEAGIARRLLFPVDPDPDVTMFRNVAALPGGVLRWFDDSGERGERTFWELRAGEAHLGKDDAYYLDAYREIVSEAIACRVRRLEDPPCLLLSGGFDSGTIAAIAAPIVAQEGREIIAATSVLGDGEVRPLGDARRAASAFSDLKGMAIHYISRGSDSPLSDLEAGFARTEECLPNDYFRHAAYRLGSKRGARLALDGHGGDYTVNMLEQGMLARILVRGKPLRFLHELRARVRHSGRGLGSVLRNEVLRPLVPRSLLRSVIQWQAGGVPLWQQRMSRDTFAASMIARGVIDPQRLRHGRVNWGRWQDRWLHMLNRTRCSLPVANNLAGEYGLDFTRPFHDPRVVELALAIPEHLQFRDGQERWLARQVFADCLPQSLITSPPGNVPENPGLHAMLAENLPAALDIAEQSGPDCPAAHYIDLSKIRAALETALHDETRMANHQLLDVAANALVVARFINWQASRNSSAQEP